MPRSWNARSVPDDPHTIIAVDLADPTAIALLRRLDVALASTPDAAVPQLSVTTLLRPASSASSLVLLPGGTLAIHGVDETLVCSPQSCIVFSRGQLTALRAALNVAEALVVTHRPSGIELADGTGGLATQSVTIVAEAGCLAGLHPAVDGWSGPALLRWHPAGAVAWSLTAAPACLDLAASVLGVPLANLDAAALADGRLVATAISPPSAETWHADTAEARFRTVSLGLAEHTDSLLAADLSDALRHAVVEACSDGEASLAARLSDALSLLPACFDADPAVHVGMAHLPWSASVPAQQPGTALLGLAPLGPPARTISLLRSLLDGTAAIFRRDGAAVPLASDAALFLARRQETDPTLGLRLPLPADPLALYGLADRLACRLATPVLAVAPDWGFSHQADPTGVQEFGNAAWFGLGLDLDDLDDATLL